MALEDESQQQRMKHFESLQSVPTLPSEIVFEILIRLSVESLLRCMSVCKSWHTLISDTHFVRSHLSFSTTNNHYAHHRLIFSNDLEQILESCSLYDVIYYKSFNRLELDYPLKHCNYYIKIVGSCNGLVCIEVGMIGLFIWNPSTRRSNMFTTESNAGVVYGFGYDESTDDYKVVAISFFHYEVKIYSLKSGNWKNIDGFTHGILWNSYSGKFLNGAIHWEGSLNFGSSDSSSWTIFSLDLANETFSEVLQPVYDEGQACLTLGVLEEWLCVICNYFGHGNRGADVWVMKVYGVRDSWTKLISLQNPFGNAWDRLWSSPCISDDEKILLQYGMELVLYDLKNGSSTKIKNYDACLQLCTVVESLVSPFAPKIVER